MDDMSLIPSVLDDIGQVANQIARQNVLSDYQDRKSFQTTRRQRADIALFEQFLAEAEQFVKGFTYDPEKWQGLIADLSRWNGITWGLVEAFCKWQLQKGYALGSVNVRLSTIKVYCKHAAKANQLSTQELALIKNIDSYRTSEARNIDEKRTQTRQKHAKKAQPTGLSPVHAELLKKQPSTKKGHRDTLIMCLLLDHALRVGEVADLNVSSISLSSGQLTIYRHKTNKTQTHNLTPDTYQAARLYLADCKPDQVPLFIGVKSKNRINTRTINERVGQLGEAIGIKELSPHDCRHFFATDAIRNRTDIKTLQDAGGWNSPAMPLRYAESAKIANEGIRLSTFKKDQKG
jgi:integrase